MTEAAATPPARSLLLLVRVHVFAAAHTPRLVVRLVARAEALGAVGACPVWQAHARAVQPAAVSVPAAGPLPVALFPAIACVRVLCAGPKDFPDRTVGSFPPWDAYALAVQTSTMPVPTARREPVARRIAARSVLVLHAHWLRRVRNDHCLGGAVRSLPPVDAGTGRVPAATMPVPAASGVPMAELLALLSVHVLVAPKNLHDGPIDACRVDGRRRLCLDPRNIYEGGDVQQQARLHFDNHRAEAALRTTTVSQQRSRVHSSRHVFTAASCA